MCVIDWVIEFTGKHPKGKKENRKYYDKPRENWISYGYSYHFGLLKIFNSIYIVYCLILIPLSYFIYYVYDCDISSSKETTNDTKNEKEETNDKTQIILDN